MAFGRRSELCGVWRVVVVDSRADGQHSSCCAEVDFFRTCVRREPRRSAASQGAHAHSHCWSADAAPIARACGCAPPCRAALNISISNASLPAQNTTADVDAGDKGNAYCYQLHCHPGLDYVHEALTLGLDAINN